MFNDLHPLSENVFNELTRQFPICCGSDEFHFFPHSINKHADRYLWDDFAPQALEVLSKKLADWEISLKTLSMKSCSQEENIDMDMLSRMLITLKEQIFEIKFYETQPTFFLTIVGIGLAESMAAQPTRLKQQAESLPFFLQQTLDILRRPPRLFRDLGIQMAEGLHAWLNQLCQTNFPVDNAVQGLEMFITGLKKIEISESFILPEGSYSRIAAAHIGCNMSLKEINEQLDEEIKETESFLTDHCLSDSSQKHWNDVIESLPSPRLPSGSVLELYGNAVDELALHCLENGLLTKEIFNACPVRVIPVPHFLKPVRSAAAYSVDPSYPPSGGTFYILEDDDPKTVSRDFRLLAAHETFPGHHLLDTARWGQKNIVRRYLEFPIFYEGWASFAEELLFDTGFFHSKADQLLMAKRRFWRAVRGKIDVMIQTGERSLPQASQYLTRLGLSPEQSEGMVKRYTLKPGYQLSYTIGRCRFRHLYDSYMKKNGKPADFALSVLSRGEIGFDYLKRIL